MQLIAHNLSKKYGEQLVVKNFSLKLQPGEVLGLLGPNGAGKSTTVSMLYGAVIPTTGQVHLGEYNLFGSESRLAKSHMGIVTQESNLDPDLDVLSNLLVFARHYRLTGHIAQNKVRELLNLVGLNEKAKANVEELSGGMKRKLILARSLVGSPKVIFLDEPTTGLDPDARQDFWKLISYLKSQGVSILLTTHYMDEAERLCDRIILMQAGEQIDWGKPAELIERTVGRKVYEVVGPSKEQIEALAEQYGVWWREFAEGYLLVKPQDNTLETQLRQMQISKLSERDANLEDVFLKLTGRRL
jgi:lipooligosaccharide transport system ATP-binding protein